MKVAENVTTGANKTALRERAAFLVAEDRISDELIAAELGVAKRTLERWKAEASFKVRVAQIIKELGEQLKALGLADRKSRLDALNDRHRRMNEVIRQRAANLKSVPGGGDTGLLVRQVKGIGKGEDFQVVEEYAVDTGLLREMREHEKQAAIEVGEWTDRTQHSFDLSNLSDEELMALAEIRRKLNSQP